MQVFVCSQVVPVITRLGTKPDVHHGRPLALGPHIGAVGFLLQGFAIDDGDVASARRDKARLFQRLQRNCDTGAMRAEHETKELVGERKLIAVDAIVLTNQQRSDPEFYSTFPAFDAFVR